MYSPVLRIDTDCLQIIIAGKFASNYCVWFCGVGWKPVLPVWQMFQNFLATDAGVSPNHGSDDGPNLLPSQDQGLRRYFNHCIAIEKILHHRPDDHGSLVLRHSTFDHFFFAA